LWLKSNQGGGTLTITPVRVKKKKLKKERQSEKEAGEDILRLHATSV
jgi:hypothetical protein